MATDFEADADIVNISLNEGDDDTFAITKQDSDGNAEDISGWTFWLTIKNDRGDTDANAVVQKTVTSHTDAANGQTEIDLTSSDTADLQGTYFYDMQYKDGNGNIKTIMTGKMFFQPDVTESTS